jgi:preprotein translocase SecE subunit
LAAKDKKSTAKPANTKTKVTRISARDDTKVKRAAKKTVEPVKTATDTAKPARRRNPLKQIARPFKSIGGYFKGAWYELTQVRWPDRRATWGMTGALLIFTAFFIVIILLLDTAFKYLFELILG